MTKETTKLTKNKDVVKNYSYDSAGNKSSFKIKVGDDTKLSLTYEYDGESKLTSVKDSDGNEVVSYDYDTDGNLSERSVAGADLTTTYTYDYQNRLTKLTNQTESAGVISKYQPEYLTNGQKSKETSEVVDEKGKNSAKTATYTYDLLGRITKETKTGSEDISYTYDSHNNRKEMTVGNKTTVYQYNQNDELLRTDTLNGETEENAVVIYKNDKNGNQLATINRYEIPNDRKDGSYVDIDVTLGDNRLNENVVNHYNALNQLTKTLTKNYKVSFTYDAEGLRTSKTVNGEKTVFVWDGDQVVMELSEGGKVQKRYIWGNDLVYVDKGENTEKTYYVTDTHGNVVQLLDEDGNVTKTYEYDSFGNEVNPEKKDDNPFRYCGEYYDKETEEIYLRARYYQPSVGRFITRDTYTGEENEPLSLHLYTYCENDGVNMVDPSGHWGKKIHEKITKEVLEENGIVNRKKYDFDTIIDYCTFPDKVQSGKVKPKAFLGFSVDDGFKQGAKWHGRNRKLLDDLKKDAKRKKLNKKITKNSREKKSRLLACILHSIEDWYAHSYILGTLDYKINFHKYKPNSAEAKFHIDWIRVRENGKLKVIKDDKEDEDGNTMHTLYKDNPKKDFNIKSKKWVSCTYSKNKRIKAAKKECKQYLKEVKK